VFFVLKLGGAIYWRKGKNSAVSTLVKALTRYFDVKVFGKKTFRGV